MTLRLFVDTPLAAGATLALPPGASRHAQVRRVQPGDALRLFDGRGHDFPAVVQAVTRSTVTVAVGAPEPVAAELPRAVTLAVGMPANERMDALVEKATELGAAALVPLECERAVLRLVGAGGGERAARKQAHWQAVAVAACEQCGRAVVPAVAMPQRLADWLAALPPPGDTLRLLLDPAPGAAPLAVRLAAAPAGAAVLALSGPEGGLAPAERAAAQAAGFLPTGLGPRVLRADTAPLALLAAIGLAG